MTKRLATKQQNASFVPLTPPPGGKEIAAPEVQVQFDALWNSMSEQERTGAAKVLDALVNPGPFNGQGYRKMMHFWRLYRTNRVGVNADPELTF